MDKFEPKLFLAQLAIVLVGVAALYLIWVGTPQ